jgi:hypothetical protein
MRILREQNYAYSKKHSVWYLTDKQLVYKSPQILYMLWKTIRTRTTIFEKHYQFYEKMMRINIDNIFKITKTVHYIDRSVLKRNNSMPTEKVLGFNQFVEHLLYELLYCYKHNKKSLIFEIRNNIVVVSMLLDEKSSEELPLRISTTENIKDYNEKYISKIQYMLDLSSMKSNNSKQSDLCMLYCIAYDDKKQMDLCLMISKKLSNPINHRLLFMIYDVLSVISESNLYPHPYSVFYTQLSISNNISFKIEFNPQSQFSTPSAIKFSNTNYIYIL